VTLKDITLDSPGDTDPSARRGKQGAAAVDAAEEPLRGDVSTTAAGSPRPEASDWTAWLGSCVGEPLMARPPGYSLPPLPSFHDSLANTDRAVWRCSRQGNDISECRVHFGSPVTNEPIGSPGTMSLQEAIIETM